MPDESPHTRIMRVVTRAVRWRPRTNRLIWFIVLALVIATSAEAIIIPAKRHALPLVVIVLISLGGWASGSRNQRRKREALAARLATLSRDDIPADVISLVAAGKKIKAIKRYRELTGAGLGEAKTLIDSL